jgi:hypothetical protein
VCVLPATWKTEPKILKAWATKQDTMSEENKRRGKEKNTHTHTHTHTFHIQYKVDYLKMHKCL